jgi:hypothetical protein
MSATVAAHPVTGNVITVSPNNPLFGTVRLDSVETSFKDGFMNKSKRSAFIRGSIEDLESMNYRVGSVIQGKIIKIEGFQPFYPGQSPKINPTTSEIILTDGKETFLQFQFTQDSNAQDTRILEAALVAEENTEQHV